MFLIAGESSSSETAPRGDIESGATSHMRCDKRLFVKLREIAPLNIEIGDPDVHAKGKGVRRYKNIASGSVRMCKLDDALHEPRLKNSLMSVMRATMSGSKVCLEGQPLVISRNGKCIAERFLHGMYYYWDTAPSPLKQNSASVADSNLWYERLGHVPLCAAPKIARSQSGCGIKIEISTDV